MRLTGTEIKAKRNDKMFIELCDEYMDMDFYKDKRSDYNYIKKKYEPNYLKFGSYISLYTSDTEQKLGYFFLANLLSVKPIYKYPAYTRYAELLEFGFVNNNLDEIKFLLDYLIEYAAARGAYFVKVRTREKSFEKFYELLRAYKHTEDDKFIYLEFPPAAHESAKHIVKYKGDRVSLKELYHLNVLGFDILEATCELPMYDAGKITVDRKTRKVSYPQNFVNIPEKYCTLGKDALTLIHTVNFERYAYSKEIIDVNYKLPGFDFELVRVTNELLSFKKEDFKDENGMKPHFPAFAKAALKRGFMVLNICGGVAFKTKHFYPDGYKEYHFLADYIGEEQ